MTGPLRWLRWSQICRVSAGGSSVNCSGAGLGASTTGGLPARSYGGGHLGETWPGETAVRFATGADLSRLTALGRAFLAWRSGGWWFSANWCICVAVCRSGVVRILASGDSEVVGGPAFGR